MKVSRDNLATFESLKLQSQKFKSGILHLRMTPTLQQLEKEKKKEVAFIVTNAKREHEISDLNSEVSDLRSQLKPPSMQCVWTSCKINEVLSMMFLIFLPPSSR
uniref:Uncharacterized protein n=1 Tax=Lactuca sativa TaxID=4236 RepID=A0A9R1XK20_LACSA|nr:hypothetical protein LSAT_V11C300144100 [Lactuca sativa]